MKIKYIAVLKNMEDIVEFSGMGTYEKNHITYFENDTKVELRINSNNLEIKRSNSEYTLEIPLSLNEETKASYFNAEINNKMELRISTIFLKIEDGYINVKYKLLDSKEDFNYELKYEVKK